MNRECSDLLVISEGWEQKETLGIAGDWPCYKPMYTLFRVAIADDIPPPFFFFHVSLVPFVLSCNHWTTSPLCALYFFFHLASLAEHVNMIKLVHILDIHACVLFVTHPHLFYVNFIFSPVE